MSVPLQVGSSVRVCEVCKTEKSDDDFYRIADKKRGTLRVERICKSCKIQNSLKRKAKNQVHEKAGSRVPEVSGEHRSLQEPPSFEKSLREYEGEAPSRLPKKYTHPNYEDWEVAQAIEVFQILLKKRDEARKKGLINW